jgi:hypothetical protein
MMKSYSGLNPSCNQVHERASNECRLTLAGLTNVLHEPSIAHFESWLCLMICRCIMGQQPRKFDATRGAILANLSELLVRQIERCVAACWQWSAGKQLQLRLVHFK